MSLPSHIRSSLCLFTLCLSVRDMASKHSTAQDGTARLSTARHLSSSAANTDKVQTPSALSALFPGAYRLGTYTCKKGTNTRKKKKNLVKHKRWCTRAVYTHIIDVQAQKKLWHGKALKSPWLQSHSASCSQRAREAAGDRYTEKPLNHTRSHTHTYSDTVGDKVPHLL